MDNTDPQVVKEFPEVAQFNNELCALLTKGNKLGINCLFVGMKFPYKLDCGHIDKDNALQIVIAQEARDDVLGGEKLALMLTALLEGLGKATEPPSDGLPLPSRN